MNLFISYARVDMPLCKQIIDAVSPVHEVWYDRRLFAGQDWWTEIQRRLHWCDGFVYLLSPESVESEYCQKEYNIARKLDKKIFPVLIQSRTKLPESLGILQYADLSQGMEHIHVLLNALTIAERQHASPQVAPLMPHERNHIDESQAPDASNDIMQSLGVASQAIESQHYDQALFLLNQLQNRGNLPNYVARMIPDMLAEAEQQLEHQAYLREAKYEYEPIAVLVKNEATRRYGCQAFSEFRQDFPDYDPETLADLCNNSSSVQIDSFPDITQILPQPFEWCEIPAGPFLMGSDRSKDELANDREPDLHELTLNAFYMAKYPVTYAQYEVFVNGDGYTNRDYWTEAGWSWKADKLHPEIYWNDSKWHIPDHPVVGVTWYEAYAFTQWLSNKVGYTVHLPTEAEWEKAARGADGRIYPYGDKFDPTKANVHETGLGKTSPVTQFPNGASPYGVMDISGNVWEWCLSNWSNPYSHHLFKDVDIENTNIRLVRGGSWYYSYQSSRVACRNFNLPYLRYYDIGFRLARSL